MPLALRVHRFHHSAPAPTVRAPARPPGDHTKPQPSHRICGSFDVDSFEIIVDSTMHHEDYTHCLAKALSAVEFRGSIENIGFIIRATVSLCGKEGISALTRPANNLFWVRIPATMTKL